jgi:hypothetical protein
MKTTNTKEPVAYQLVKTTTKEVHSTHPTYEQADREAESVFWMKGYSLAVVEVYEDDPSLNS